MMLCIERVYLPLYQVANKPFHIQGDDLFKFHGILSMEGFIWFSTIQYVCQRLDIVYQDARLKISPYQTGN